MKLLGLIWFVRLIYAGSMYSRRSKYYVMYGEDSVGDLSADVYLNMNKDIEEFGEFNTVELARLNGTSEYLCFLPKDQEIQQNDTTLEEYSQTEMLQSAIRLINQSFDNSTCVFAYELHQDYWTFGYCFGDKIIQYHEDVQNFIKTGKHRAILPDHVYALGRFPGATKKEVLIENQTGERKHELKWQDFQLFDSQFTPYQSNAIVEDSSQKIIQHKLTDGETCDITKQPRSIDITYICDMNNAVPQILDVSEVQTCKYQMVIGVPRLCLLDGFKPVARQEKEIRIDCKLIDNSIDNKQIETFEDFFETGAQKPVSLFATKGYKVNLRDYILQPTGSGFFLGYSKNVTLAKTVWGGKNLFFYNQQYDTNVKLLESFGQMFYNNFEWRIPSPIMLEKNRYTTLNWNDSFIVWYEMYDFHGELTSLVKVYRDALQESRRIELLIIDPETFLDQNNEKVEVNQFDAPNNMWNFEHFNRHKRDSQGNVVYDGTDIPTATVYVTKTVNTESSEPTNETEDIISQSSYTPDQQPDNDWQSMYEKLAHELGIDDIDTLHEAMVNLNLEIVRPEDTETIERIIEHDEL